MDVLSNQGTWTANPCREGPRTMLLSPWQQVVDLLLAATGAGGFKPQNGDMTTKTGCLLYWLVV